MSKLTQSLIDYWRALPAHSAAARRRGLEECVSAVRSGVASRESLIPYALGDTDDELVFDATMAFLDAGARPPSVRQGAIDDAVEWVRRGLALNRGAVFAALVSVGDEDVNARLAPYRLLLDAGETETVWKRAAGDTRKPTREFLRAWRELLGAEVARQRSGVASAALAVAAA